MVLYRGVVHLVLSNVYFIYFSSAHFLATSLKQLVSLNMHGVCCLTVYSNQLQLLWGSMPLLTIYIYTPISNVPSSLHGITARNRHTIFFFLFRNKTPTNCFLSLDSWQREARMFWIQIQFFHTEFIRSANI